MAAATRGGAVVDTRGDFKVPEFTGRNEDWPTWCVRFEAYAELAGWYDRLEIAGKETQFISLATASDENLAVARALYSILLSKVDGKAFALVALVPRGNGLEAWRRLREEYCGSSSARLAGLVREVLYPRDAWAADAASGKEFPTSLNEWEGKLQEYCATSLDSISETVKIATVLDHAPPALARRPAQRAS